MGSTGGVYGNVAMAGMSYGNAATQAQGLENEGRFKKSQLDFNARMNDMAIADVSKRSDVEVAEHGKKVSGVIGSQRAMMAAQGLDVDSGSAYEIQQDTREIGARDQRTIKNNAWKEAYGLKVQSADLRTQGDFAALGSKNAASNTLAMGGMQALDHGIKAYGIHKEAKKK